MTEFSIACSSDDTMSSHVVTLSGEIDVATVAAVRDFLLGLTGDVKVDCRDVTFIDSQGLGMFVGYDRSKKAEGKHFSLVNLSSSCWKLFEVTGLLGQLDVTPTEGTAPSS